MVPRPFPVFLDLVGRPCVVFGAGPEAQRKIAALLHAGAVVRTATEFDPAFLRDAALVMVAGASQMTAEAAAAAAQRRGIPINVADEPRLCSFLMPAIVDRAPVVVAISTGGAAPALARQLRIWLEQLLPRRLGELATLAGRFRPLVRRRLAEPEMRRRFWQDVFAGDIGKRALDGEPAAGALAAALDEAAAANARPSPPYSSGSAV
ncbi:MAG TPA: bifunctional precorrin-2 dehydrogenase/sirohydrochlorin ferrochelatase [Stellaceae bacterium]|nr:bifunctional precorrin-2 dehydrogenase/sirohydrochlorin ferrochelatase [Stellaceae bacterium]